MGREPQIYNTEVSATAGGLHLDNDPVNQPKGTLRFALNAVVEASDGKYNTVSNEE